MDTLPQDDLLPSLPDGSSLTRRGFLRGATLAGGGLLAAGLAACTSDLSPVWTYGPVAPAPGGSAAPSTAPSAAASAAPSAAPSSQPSASAAPSGDIPPGWSAHDMAARDVVRRYIGDLAPALQGIYGDAAFAKLVGILGAAQDYPELHEKPAFVQVPQLVLNDLLTPLAPTLDGDVKVFDLTIDEIE